jgi:hypothetical protein
LTPAADLILVTWNFVVNFTTISLTVISELFLSVFMDRGALGPVEMDAYNFLFYAFLSYPCMLADTDLGQQAWLHLFPLYERM